MRYPFTPEILDALPEELAELYRGIEDTLLQEICSRLNGAGELNEVTVDAIKALRSHGIPLDDIKKAIANTNKISMKKLDKLFDDVVARNQAYYSSLIDLAHVTAPEVLVNERDIAAIRRQTWGAYKNITGSMGFLVVKGGRLTMLEPAKAYHWALDSAVLQIQSGAIDYNHAISRAVKQLAESGLKTVNYESGHVDSVDVAVRRAIMTGVNQLNQKYREQSMDYLGTDLVETTAHLGARNVQGPNGWEAHTEWQGKVYRWNRGGGESKAELPRAPEPPEPQEPPTTGAHTAQTPRRSVEPLDVTQEYLNAATPGQGSITYDETFDQSRHQAEVSFSKWLQKMFGGDLHLLDEVNQDKVQTPDYLWRKKLWDLKTVTTEKAADAAIRHGLKQINDNPGGIFLDYRGREIDLLKLQSVIDSRMRHSKANSVDIMVALSDTVVKVFRYKK